MAEETRESRESSSIEFQEVRFVVGRPGSERVYEGTAYVGPDIIYIGTVDADGTKWLDDWCKAGYIVAQEIKIKTKGTRENRKKCIFDGFASLHYRNPRGRPEPEAKGIEQFIGALRVHHPFRGTPLHRNWHEIERTRECWYVEEYLMFSDVDFAGQLELGPYALLYTFPEPQPVMGVFVFRVHIHGVFRETFGYAHKDLDPKHPSFRSFRERTIVSFAGEMAALLSFATDRRIVAGNTLRMFGPQFEDPKGMPRDPGKIPHIHSATRSVLPYYSSKERAGLDGVKELIGKYFKLHTNDAATFLRAALLYQKALLQCDHEPDFAWLWCVGAVETLAEVPGETTGVSRRFMEFLEKNIPDPPLHRPPYARVDWTDLGGIFAQIYAFRSQFLHAGLPFPAHMKLRPERVGTSEPPVYAEMPSGGLSIGGTSFQLSEPPMHLHVFMYIVRRAMLKWLDGTLEATRGQLDPDPPEGEA